MTLVRVKSEGRSQSGPFITLLVRTYTRLGRSVAVLTRSTATGKHIPLPCRIARWKDAVSVRDSEH